MPVERALNIAIIPVINRSNGVTATTIAL